MRSELPAYVVLSDPGGAAEDGTKNWSARILPAIYQGTQFRSSPRRCRLQPPREMTPAARRRQLGVVRSLNLEHLQRHPENFGAASADRELRAAARCRRRPTKRSHCSESRETQELYGLTIKRPGVWQTLPDRRGLSKRGRSLVQVFLSASPGNTHSNNARASWGFANGRPAERRAGDGPQASRAPGSTIVMWTGVRPVPCVAGDRRPRITNRRALFTVGSRGGGLQEGFTCTARRDSVRI